MNCGSCNKEILPDSVFCTWCGDFIPSSGQGKKANLFARWVALALDPMIAVMLWGLGVGIIGLISSTLGIVAAVILPFVYLVWFLTLLRQGLTPGKKLLGLQVVDYHTGSIPGFGKMFLREFVGRFISGLFSGLGYFWAIFDKNSQAWHDKIAGTVVLKRAPGRAPAVAALAPVAVEQLLTRTPASELAAPAPRFSFSGSQLLAAGTVLALFAGGAAWGISRVVGARRQPAVTATAVASGSLVSSASPTPSHKVRADAGSTKSSTVSSPTLLTAAGATRHRSVVVQQSKGPTRPDSAAAERANVPPVPDTAFRRPVRQVPAAVEQRVPDSSVVSTQSPNADQGASSQVSRQPSRVNSLYLPQFMFLVGEWECMTSGNHYRMRVAWDSTNNQFRGYLSRQGQLSETVGFELGELIWMAQPRGAAIIAEQYKWRFGANGVSTNYQWRQGHAFVQRSSADHLVLSAQEFTRVR